MADTNELSSYYEPKFSGLFQKAPIGMLLLKGSGQIEFVNPYAEKLFGNSNKVFVGLTFGRFIPELLQKKMVGVEKFCSEAQRLKSNARISCSNRFTKAD